MFSTKGYREWWFKNRSTTPLFLIFLILWRGQPNRFSFRVGGFFILLGEVIRVIAVSTSGLATRARKVCADFLTTGGIYRFTRNPIYLGNFLLSLGFIVIARVRGLLPWFLALFAVQYQAIIALEEEYLRNKFPLDYPAYENHVPRFFPRLSPPPFVGRGNQRLLFPAILNERHTLATIFFLLFVLEKKLRGDG